MKNEALQHSPGNKWVVWEFANGKSLVAVGDRISKGIVMGEAQVIFVVGFDFFPPHRDTTQNWIHVGNK